MICQFCRAPITFDDVGRSCPTAERLSHALGGGTSHHRPDNRHKPTGDPCRCGRAAAEHRVNHNSQGDPCTTCSLPASSHLKVRPRRTAAITAALRTRDGWRCMLCRKPFEEPEPRHPDPKSVTLDHIVPTWKNGPDTVENLRLAHRICNMKRNAGELTPAQRLRDERAEARWAEILDERGNAGGIAERIAILRANLDEAQLDRPSDGDVPAICRRARDHPPSAGAHCRPRLRADEGCV